MPRVLIADQLSDAALKIFQDRGVEAEVAVGLKPDQLKAKLQGVDGLAVRSATKVTADVLAAAPQLKVIGRAGIGVDNIDVAAATARGVVVMNTPHGNAITTAEHAIALLFALAREIPAADRSTRSSKWEKNRFMGVELTGKTLGVIGCGNIGSIVAERAVGLKMKVVAYDPYLSDDRAASLGLRKVELDSLLRESDFITLHVPMTEQTRGLIDAKALAKTRRGVRIVNCARGGLVVEEDLKAAIESGQVAGAALDVFAVEPAKDNPLFALEQVVCTPHLGASTNEAQEKVALQVAEQMSDYLLTGAVTNALNMPSLTAEEARRLGPYMKLAELLGSFAGQLTETGVKRLKLEYEGEAAELNTKPLTAGGADGLPEAHAGRGRQHGERADHRARAQHRGDRDQAQPRRRLRHAAALHRGDRPARAQPRRHAVRRQEAASGRGQGHRGRGRALAAHALHHQPRQAGLHRRRRHGSSATPASTSRPSTSAAPTPAARRSRCSASTMRSRPSSWPRCARCPTSARRRRSGFNWSLHGWRYASGRSFDTRCCAPLLRMRSIVCLANPLTSS